MQSMNSVKRPFSVLIILGICFSVATFSASPAERDEMRSNYRTLQMDNADIFLDSLAIDSNGFHVFPDYFGGIYICNDGILVIQVVKTFASGHNQAAELFQGLNLVGIRFEFVEFSFNELSAMMQYLAEIMIEYADSNLPLMFGSVSLDELRNRVRVNLRVHSEEQIALFKRLFSDSSMIVFGEHFDVIPAIGIVPFSTQNAERHQKFIELLTNLSINDK